MNDVRVLIDMSAEACRDRGAAWLDEYRPGWRSAINWGALDMNSWSACVAGQAFGIDPHGEDAGQTQFDRVMAYVMASEHWTADYEQAADAMVAARYPWLDRGDRESISLGSLQYAWAMATAAIFGFDIPCGDSDRDQAELRNTWQLLLD
jgi:hypothetical protein